MRSRQIRRSQRRAGRPSLESLEVRALMASASDLFARIDGVVPAGTGGDTVNVTISKTGGDFAFVGSGVSLGFLVQGTGGATLSPAAVQVRNAAGTLMTPAFTSNASSPGGRSVAIERLPAGTYSVTVGGQGTAGGYELDVTLVGDTVGLGHKVGTADGTTIRNLQGVDSTNPSYVAGADINRDGIIGSFDYLQYRGNLGAQTTIAPMPLATDLTPSPTTLADGRQVITSTATTIEGTTTPGAIVSVETGSDTSFGGGTTTAAADGHFSLPLTLAEGVDTITVRAADPGLFGQRRLSTTVVSLDTQAPVVAVTSPAAGAVVSGNVDVLGSAVDAVAGLAALTEQVDGGTAMNVTVDASGHFDVPTSFALDGSADGPHTVRFVATDLVGHSSTPLDVSFTLLTTAGTPTVTIGSPSSGVYVNNDIHITGTATDPSAKIASVAARVDGGASVPVSFVAATGAFDYTTTLALDGSADGAHTVVITATDTGGRSSSSSVSYHLKTTLPAAPKFMLSTSDQAGGPGIANPSLTTTAGRVSLVGLTDPNLTVTLTPTGATSLANSAGKFQFPGVALAPGLNDFTVTVTDLAGNTNQYHATVIRAIGGAGSNEVVRWNAIQLEAIRLDSTAPEAAARGLAMVGAAVLDSINAIDGTPAYYVKLNAATDASPQAAVATAAYKVLSDLYPAQQATLDAEYALALGELADGSAKADGVSLGNSAGDAIVALRLHDGSTNYVDYQYGSGPNAYVATAPMYMVAELPQYANLTPFGMTSPSQFRAPAPLAINSPQWLADAQKTQSLGNATSTTRTADQTQQAKFWSDGTGTYTPAGHWNQIAETVAGNQGDSLSQDARLFAELNVSMADSAIAAWNTKYFYNTVRPITIIRAGDPADAPGLVADPSWTPLITTPPHPEYVSGHSTFSGSAAEVLDSFFGASTSFTIGSYILPGVTRSFSGFDQAAAEAGESRIYGGIHFEFSNTAGQAVGIAVADFDLKTFAVKSDTVAPTVVVTSPMAGSDAPGNVSIAGRVLDNLSGVATLTASIDGAAAKPIAFDADGNFHIGTSFGLDGKSDGTHTVAFVATDVAGNVASPLNFPFTLDTKAPALAITGPVAGTLPTNATLAGTADGTGTPIASLSYNFDGGPSTPVSFDPATGAFSQVLDLSKLAPGNHAFRLSAVDSAGNTSSSSIAVVLAAPPALTLAAFLPMYGAVDVGVTYRPKVTFSRPIDPSTLTSASFFAMASGVALPAAIVPSDDRTYAYLFFTNPVPGASTVTVTVDGSKIKGPEGALLDAAGTGVPGSVLSTTYTTVSRADLTGTSLSGIVADPGPDLKPSTFDDVKVGPDNILGTADDVYKLPIAGVTVSILGTDLKATTDALGRYSFPDVPSGDVKLSLDGRTATNAPPGFYFPEMVMDLTLRPGQANTVMGSMGTYDQQAAGSTNLGSYLPRVLSAILQPVSMTADTTIRLDAASSAGLTPSQAKLLTIDVAANSLVGPDGQKMSSGMIGISVVPPEIVKDMLPAGVLQHTFDITIQAPGITNFSTPAKMTFPNVFNAAPGTKLNFLSFDHTTGRLVIEGTATVAADGLSVVTDPGNGITHPGWHGLTPPGTPTDGPGPAPPPPPPPRCLNDEKIIDEVVDIGIQVGKCAADLLGLKDAVSAILSFAEKIDSAAHDAFDLYDAYKKGGKSEAFLSGVKLLNDTKGAILVTYEYLQKNGNPIAKGLKISKCIEDLLNIANNICDKITKVEGSVCNTVATKAVCYGIGIAKSLLAQVNSLVEAAEKGLNTIGFRLVCSKIDVLTSLLNPPAGNHGSDDEIAQVLLDIGNEFNVQLGNAQPMADFVNALTQGVGQSNQLQDNAAAMVYSIFGGPKGSYFAFTYNNFTLRGRTDAAGHINAFLPADTDFTLGVYDPQGGRVATYSGHTPASGSTTHLPILAFGTTVGLPDGNADGIPDVVKDIIGLSHTRPDTARDGIPDLVKLQQGLDPLAAIALPTGIIANLPLMGEARAVAATGSVTTTSGQTAYVATGSYGLAIVNATSLTKPIIQGQIALKGDNQDVAYDGQHAIAAVASGAGGLNLVDVTDPTAPKLIQTITLPFGAQHIQVVDGQAYAASGRELVQVDLASGEVVQTLDLGGTQITGMARSGSILYTMDQSLTLRAVDVSGFQLLVRGSVVLADGGGQLFVSNGIAYAAAATNFRGGYATADVSNPDNLKALAASQVGQTSTEAGTAIVPNGSGLGLLIGTPPRAGNFVVDLMDLSAPTKTNQFLTRIALPAAPGGVAIASGIAFVADGTSGLQVVNYLGFDTKGVGPTASIANLDGTPSTVVEGSSIPIKVAVGDDVQVRNVELLVNGKVVANDVSSPFDFSVIAPSIASGATTVAIQVRATDTGGNVTLSNTLSYTLVADTVAPTVLGSTPSTGQKVFLTPSIDVRFSKPLDPSILDLNGAHLRFLGLNGADTPTVVPIRSVELHVLNHKLSVYPQAPLDTGVYELTLDASEVADRAGNHIASPFVLDFAIRPASDVKPNSGLAAIGRAPAANVGQEIKFSVPWQAQYTTATFATIDGSGNIGTAVVNPSRFDNAAHAAYFVVPANADTGNLSLAGTTGNNYTAFADFAVTRGSVNLYGTGGYDPTPGHGMYVSLNGRLESRQILNLAPGTYTLSFKLAGSHQGGANAVAVSLGTAYAESFNLASTDPFTAVTRTITVGGATAGILAFDQSGSGGALLDDVSLTQAGVATALLSDNFDGVLPDGPLPLQIVPTVSAVTETYYNTGPYHGGQVTLQGSGFIHNQTTVDLGSLGVTGSAVSVGYYFNMPNDGARVMVPLGAPFGPLVVQTNGGTSAALSLTFSGIAGVAASGAPADPTRPSANPGQAITITGTHLSLKSAVVFPIANTTSVLTERIVAPVAVSADGTSAVVIVPVDAASGVVGVVGDQSDTHAPIQVIPRVTAITVNYSPSDGTSVNLVLHGSGFVRGNGTVYTIGGTVLVDADGTKSSVGGTYVANDTAYFTIPTTLASLFGPVTVTTAGGTTVSFSVGYTGVVATALSGSPTDPTKSSANPGQSVALTGTGLNLGTSVVGTYVDSGGTTRAVVLTPYYANAAGTEIDVLIPGNFNGVGTLRVVGSSASFNIQVVPLVQSATPTGIGTIRLRGRGFVAAHGSVYNLPGLAITDNGAAGVRVGYDYAFDNDGVDLSSLAHYGTGAFTVTTTGGTSAPLNLASLSPAAANLLDVAAEPGASGKLWVAAYNNILQVDPATGATLKTFAYPGTLPYNYAGIQVLPAAATIAGVAVPAGSLLVTNGYASPDRIDVLSAADGSVLATLHPAKDPATGRELDPVAGVYDPGTGHVFVLAYGTNQIDELDAQTGAVLHARANPVSQAGGGLALDPSTGDLWVGSDSGTTIALVRRSDGATLRQLDTSLFGVAGGVGGLAFDGQGRLLASSYYDGVVSRITLPADLSAPLPAETRPTIISIGSTAADGIPSSAGIASANVAQAVTVVGTNLSLNTQVLFPTLDNAGNRGTAVVYPTSASADGTTARVVVPDGATSGAVTVGQIGTHDYGFSGYTDAVYRGVSAGFTAAGGTDTLRIADGGLQGLADESWGIDNVRVIDATTQVTLYSTDFESGAGPEWSDRTTDNSLPGRFTQFLGRYSNGGSTLSLAGLAAGHAYTLKFDFFAIDTWDGNDPYNGVDSLNVSADGTRVFHETFANYSTNTQTYRGYAAGSVPLLVVPTLTGVTGLPGSTAGFTLIGSGFAAGATSVTVGGLSLANPYANETPTVSGTRNDHLNTVVGLSAVEGAITVTTAGGTATLAAIPYATPPFAELDGIAAAAAQGVPKDATKPSANAAQTITIIGRGLTNSSLVQFTAADATGAAGILSRTGTASADGTSLSVVVPAQAKTGPVRVVGAAGSFLLQVVPSLRSVGGSSAVGGKLVLEGGGLVAGELAAAIDGVDAGTLAITDVYAEQSYSYYYGYSNVGIPQQLVDLTVPAGATAGVVTVTTAGGSYTLRPASTVTTLPAYTPPADPGETIAAATSLSLPAESRVALSQQIGDNATGAPTADVDLYKVTLAAGDTLEADLAALSGSAPYPTARLFDAAGHPLAIGYYYNASPTLRFTAPAAGSYYVGVSGYGNNSYDPNDAANRGSFSYTGGYTLGLERRGGGSSSIASIGSTATSGVPTRAAAASAVAGQTVTIHGSGFRAGDYVTFTVGQRGYYYSYYGNALTTRSVSPVSVAADGTSLTVVVPDDAATGAIRLTREDAGAFLQVVPTALSLDVPVGQGYHSGTVTIAGTGFVQGSLKVSFGGQTLVEAGGAGDSFNVGSNFGKADDSLSVRVPNGAPTGPIRVSTVGGTSDPIVTTFATILATTTTGTPADPTKPSANPGQAITLTGTHLSLATDVVFQIVDSGGNVSERVVRPVAAAADGTNVILVVPIDAISGPLSILGDSTSTLANLQVVPILTSVHLTGFAADATSASAQLRGVGFVQGHDSLYRFGAIGMTDAGNSGAPINAGGYYVQANDGAALSGIPVDPSFFGPVTVTTAGGTSAPYIVADTTIAATALSGTPADPSKPSANPGQSITLKGTGLTTLSDVVATYTDGSGNPRSVVLNPYYANVGGTEADVLLPGSFNGISTIRRAGSSTVLTLQIVPVLKTVAPTGINTIRVRGLGLLAGQNTAYNLPGATVVDAGGPADPIRVGAYYAIENDGADLTALAHYGTGAFTVTTTGGTSAPLNLASLSPAAANLLDVAAEPGASGKLWVAAYNNILQVDPATGATLKTFAYPGTLPYNYAGIQVLPAAATIAGVAVPAGSLLVTNGYASPDRIDVLSAADGSVLATLHPAKDPATGRELDPVAGVYDPGTGHVFVLAYGTNQIDELDAQTGAVLHARANPVSQAGGGLALDPSTGDLWVGSDSGTTIALVRRSDGATLRQLDTSLFGVAGGVGGLAFDGQGRLLASSYYDGVVSRITLPADLSAPLPAETRPTIISIGSTAADGIPSSAGIASANVAQAVTVVGTNLSLNTQVLFPTLDNAGNRGTAVVYPTSASADGTTARVVVPDGATSGAVTVGQIGTHDYGFSGNLDAVYRGVSAGFTAAGGTDTLRIADGGLQGLADESWGIDNVRVIDATTQATLYSTDFESGAGPEWSDRTTDNSLPGRFTEFLGRYSNGGSTLSLAGLAAGHAYTLKFDFFAIDSWDGNDPYNGVDSLNVTADGTRVFHETFANYGTNTQTYRGYAAGSVPLLVVPTLTGISGLPGRDATFTLTGSGFAAGGTTVAVGGVSETQPFGNLPNLAVTGTRNDTLNGITLRTSVEGAITVTTAGGTATLAAIPYATPPFAELDGIAAAAAQGVPKDATKPSANAAQTITIIGRGLTNSSLVQFTAADATGAAGILSRTGTASADGTSLSVVVPAQAKTGPVRVVGAAGSFLLQVVPSLRSVGGSSAVGGRLVLEGSGLVAGELAAAVDGVDAGTLAITDGSIEAVKGYYYYNSTASIPQQLVDLTVPAGATAGVVTVTTAGGSYTLRPASTVTTLPAYTPPADPGETIAAATSLSLPAESRVALSQQIGDNATGAPTADVDLYKVTLAAGDTLEADLAALSGSAPYPTARLFDAAGHPLAIGYYNNASPTLRFTAPAAGSYYVGVSGYGNNSYDPNDAANRGSFYYTGGYTLGLERRGGGSSSIASIGSTATSGVPTRAAAASAVAGQTVTIHGSGFRAGDHVTFTVDNGNSYYGGGSLSTQTVVPASVAADGTSLTVVVPDAAVTGEVSLTRESAGAFLQIVPTVADASLPGAGYTYHSGPLTIKGSGFAQGQITVHFGNLALVQDSGSGNPISAGNTYAVANDGIRLTVPAGVSTGPISVTTLGGTSGTAPRTFTGAVAVAATGTPADPSKLSANPGQAITIQGIGLSKTTDVIFQVVDSAGSVTERSILPTAAAADGTSATVLVPVDAYTGPIIVVGDLLATQAYLQVVPVLTTITATYVDPSGTYINVQLRGAGLVQGHNSLYQFGGVGMTDSGNGGSPINVGYYYAQPNDGATLNGVPFSAAFFGAVTVTTAGGTSAPLQAGYTGLTSTAATGTPADPTKPSANPGQQVTITGTGLSQSTQLVASYVSSYYGTVQTILLTPTSALSDGSAATVVLPVYLDGAFTLNVVGSPTAPLLQIVPVLSSVSIPGTHSATLHGAGFVEDRSSSYSFAGVVVTDTGTPPDNIDVYYSSNENDSVNLTSLPSYGAGKLTVTTAGGTSAPLTIVAGLHAAALPPSTVPTTPTPTLTDAQLAPIVAEAKALWRNSGLDPALLARLAGVRVATADLAGGELGQAGDGTVLIDRRGGSLGWFIDPSPAANTEFAVVVGGDERVAAAGSPAAGRYDLLTVVEHEIGHELGLGHVDTPHQLMDEDLPAGVRRFPTATAKPVTTPVVAIVAAPRPTVAALSPAAVDQFLSDPTGPAAEPFQAGIAKPLPHKPASPAATHAHPRRLTPKSHLPGGHSRISSAHRTKAI